MARAPDEIAVPEHGLVLRRLRVDHAERMLTAVQLSHPELHQWMPWASRPPSPDSIKEFIDRAGADTASDLEMAFGLFEPDEGLVGGFGLHGRRGPGVLEIGYWVRSDRTGRGYATAAARALTDAALDCFAEAHRAEIRCDAANLASAAIPPKLGYRLEGREPSEVLAAAQTGTLLVWAVSRDDWRKGR